MGVHVQEAIRTTLLLERLRCKLVAGRHGDDKISRRERERERERVLKRNALFERSLVRSVGSAVRLEGGKRKGGRSGE
jgi:hypothetical protein